jgi:hypothetical protein
VRATKDTGVQLVAAPPPAPQAIAFLLASDGQWLRLTSNGERMELSPFATWSRQVDWKHVLLADVTGEGTPDLIGLAKAEPTADNGSWWVSRFGERSFESAVWGSLRLPLGVSIRATLPTVS